MAKDTKRRLGKGLSSLMSEPVAVSPGPETRTQEQLNNNNFRYIATEDIRPNRFQPRAEFGDASLDSLAASIRADGVMQPLLVRSISEGKVSKRVASWELVAGERRWRAALLAGLRQVPCLVTTLGDQQAAEWALVENLQREDLGTLELANAFAQLQQRFGLTQEQIADRVGMHRASVANHLRILELDEPLQRWVQDGSLSFGHAKVLLSLPVGEGRLQLARRAVRQGLSIRAMEQAAAQVSQGGPAGGTRSKEDPSASMSDLERRLGEHLGTRVRVHTQAGGKKGRLELAFYDLDHFESLLQKIGFRN